MRRVMKSTDYCNADLVIKMPPFIMALLRKHISQNYWKSRGLKPAACSFILAGLLHPNYTFNKCTTDSTTEHITLQECLDIDPGYLYQRILDVVNRFHLHGVVEMTATLFISILKGLDVQYEELVKNSTKRFRTYVRAKSIGVEYVTVYEDLCSTNRYGVVSNEPETPIELRWRQLTDDLIHREKVPSCVLTQPLKYFLVKADGFIVTTPVYKQINWSILDRFHNNDKDLR